jgi:hypothetical protein
VQANQEGNTVMQSYLQSAATLHPEHVGAAKPAKRDDLIYQVMTIAAMVIVLVSVWVF